jgi:diguanylate cyclase (GGDEF)-like protein/PAS domain S-box-containing protein
MRMPERTKARKVKTAARSAGGKEADARRFLDLADQAPVGIFETDVSGACIFVNRRWCEISGLDAATSLIQGWKGAIHPADRERVAREWDAATREGRDSRIEYRIRRPDGETRWVVGSGRARRDASGAVLGHVGTVLDVTEGTLAKRALEHSQAKLEAILGTAVDGILTIDASGTVLSMNRAASTIFGYAPEEMLGRDVTLLMPEPYKSEHPAYLRRYLATNEPHIIGKGGRVVQGLRKDGSTFPLDLSVSEVRVGSERLFAGIVRDISSRIAAQARLTESEARFRSLADTAPVLIWTSDAEARRDFCDKTWLDFTGRDMKQEAGDGWTEGLHPDDLARCLGTYREAFAARRPFDAEYRLRRADGEYRWIWDTGVPRLAPDGGFVGYIGSGIDVTEQKRLRESMRLAARVFEDSKEGIMITARDGTILDVNTAFAEMTGYSKAEILGKKPSLLKSGRHDADFYAGMWNAIFTQGQWSGEIWDRRKNGEIYPKWLSIGAVRDQAGEITHCVAIFTDITAMKQSEERLQHLAHYDFLTGLPNRILFRDRLAQAMRLAERRRQDMALMFIDLDRFKAINDSLGHEAGDALLVEVGRRISACVRKSDTVARLGGDEFTVVVGGLRAPDAAAVAAEKIIASVGRPLDLEGVEVSVTPSIGIAVFPDDGANPDELVKNADTAMYHAKDQGRNTYRFYSGELSARASQRLSLEDALRRALDNGQMAVHYQPLVALRDGALYGAEALLRWTLPGTGPVPPERFVPLAEETGLIVALGEFVLAEVAALAPEVRAILGPAAPFRLAVNLSPRQFRHPGLPGLVTPAIQSCGPAGRLDIELAEDTVMEDPEETARILTELKAKGLGIAIDDFGTGRSSLGRLKRLPLDALKIDRALIAGLPQDREGAALVRAIVALAHGMGLEVSAEGVETAGQAEFLRRVGCDTAQGHHFHRPMPRDALLRLLAEGRLAQA